MPSDPRAASSSSSGAKPSSSSSSKPSSSSSGSGSSGSSSSRPSGSSSSSSAPAANPGPPPVPTPYISANAWMSFFLFCCLVLIILQGPLGLTGGTNVFPGFPNWNTWGAGVGVNVGGLPGCTGLVATHVPWCQQVAPVPVIQQVQQVQQPMIVQEVVQPVVQQQQAPPMPQMGGQGHVATPDGGAGWSWYSNSQQPQQQPPQGYYAASPPSPPRYRSVQYQRPGLQVQVTNNNQGALPLPPPPPLLTLPPSQYIISPEESWFDDIWWNWDWCEYIQGYQLIPFAYAHSIGPPRYPSAQVVQQRQVYAAPAAVPVQPAPIVAAPVVPPVAAMAGLANLENAFYPLLIGAIALLVIFDYAS